MCRNGEVPYLTASHPQVVEAANIVGVKKAIRYLLKPPTSTDIMDCGNRMPGSFRSRQ